MQTHLFETLTAPPVRTARELSPSHAPGEAIQKSLQQTDMPELPEGWKWVRLGDLATYINGRAFKPSEWGSKGMPIIRIQNLNQFEASFNYCDFTVEDKYHVKRGDLLFAWSGTPGTSFGAHIWNRSEMGVLNQHIFKIILNERVIDRDYYLHALNDKVREFVAKAHGTAGLAHITKKKFEESKIALPPLPIQQAIVSKIEELFSELDKSIECLKTAQQQLKVYRQAVLKWAFEGKLHSSVRTGRDPSSSIASEIRTAHELSGQSPTEKSSPSENQGSDQLPEGWKWVKIKDVANVGTGATPLKSNSSYYGGNIPWVTSGALNDESVTLATDFVTEKALKETNLSVYPKGTLLVAMYGEGKTRGKCSELRIEATTNQAIAAIYFEGFDDSIKPYLKHFLLKNYNDVRLQSSGGVQPNLNLGIIKNLKFPLAPREQQTKVVEAIEYRLSVADQIEESIRQSLDKAEALRQSILKKAFEGKLV